MAYINLFQETSLLLSTRGWDFSTIGFLSENCHKINSIMGESVLLTKGIVHLLLNIFYTDSLSYQILDESSWCSFSPEGAVY